jgi:hypothetical protein
MFIYQSVIMLVIVISVFVLAYVIKIKHRTTVLALAILVLVVGGSLSINLIQDYFLGVHVAPQNVDVKLYNNMRLSDTQKDTLAKTFSDFNNITGSSIEYKTALEKTYTIKNGGVNSSIKVDLLLFKSEASANENFKQHQMFGESVYKMFSEKKFFIPEDPSKSKITKTYIPKYITSFIRSNYTDYTELMYVPKNIYYQSEIVVQDGNFILYMTERTNKPASEKNTILKEIVSKLAKVK